MSCNSLPRLLLTSAVYVVGLAGIAVPTASAAVQNRINAQVSNNSQVAISGSVQPLVQSATDMGPAPGNTRLSMSIRFNMTAAQEAALDQLLADQQNPSSPSYHQWLTPAQYAAQFGVSGADIAKVAAWLQSEGFTVTGVGNGATFITFQGTVAQAQAAFGTTIRSMSRNGEMHYANVTDVQVPSALGGVVQAVTGLQDFHFRPHVRTSVANPQFTSSQSGNHFLAPGDIYTIYNSTSLESAGGGGIGTGTNCKSVAATGTTVVPACADIAVVGQIDLNANNADIVAFRSAAGLSTTNLPTTVHATGLVNGVVTVSDPGTSCGGVNANCFPNQGDLDESSIDVEWAGAMAPTATVAFVNAVSVLPGPTGLDAMTYAIDTNIAPIITTSYGNCEAAWGSTQLAVSNALFKQANAQGQTILAAAGDSGATDCDTGASPDLGYAIEGWNTDFPSSSPYVTSMGGTQFNGDAEATGSGSTWGATQYWSGTSGSDVVSSALSYIPETVWNDATSAASFGGGGGGPSAYFAKPAWQQGTPADASRDVPDISLAASDSHDPFLYCVNVSSGTSCTSGFRISSGTLTVAGGTSFDSQIFGGLVALIEQKNGGGRLGNINPTLYALANSSTYASQVFHDITAGGNQMPCVSGTPNCGNGGSTGFAAAAGYDLASGWGSVNVSNLATDWTKVTPLGSGSLSANASATTLTATPSSLAAGATATLTATVTGSAGTPTGSVQFLANNVALGSSIAVSALNATTATASNSWVTTCSNLGQNVLKASYSGDSVYQPSIGPILASGEIGNTGGTGFAANGSVIVSPVEVQVTNNNCPDFSLSTTTTTVTVAAGGTIPPVTISVAAVNGFTGTVNFTATVTSTSGYSPTLTFTPASITLPGQTSTSLALSGITADLHIPSMPGKVDPGTMLAQRGTPAAHSGWQAAGSGVAIASLLLLTLPRRRRRLGGLLLVALAVALVGGATGCGGSSSTTSGGGGGTQSNPYVGTYSITVVGTYTSTGGQVTTHSQVVTYTIN